METSEFAERFLLNLPFEPTAQQISLVAALARYCTRPADNPSAFILNGYAGTGKTSVVGALVRTLRECGSRTVLLAPTGRAAKVFAAASDSAAYTIHRRIYHAPSPQIAGYCPSLTINRIASAIFIVDEASMIGDNESEQSGSLLRDLVEHVYAGAPGCRLIFVGDTAQLPPVGCDTSPAMNPAALRRLGLRVSRVVMTETVRQRGGSAILLNATRLRRQMRASGVIPPPQITVGGDVDVVEGYELLDTIASAYSRSGIDDTILITRSNRSATEANRAIRAGVLFSEEELVRGERLMIAKNNYLWSSSVAGLDFMANGDIATVDEVLSTVECAGMRFADVRLFFPYRDVTANCKIMLDTLSSASASLEPERLAALWRSRTLALGTDSRTVMRRDPYLNALQVKYAYAVTCHKAQGGQWREVFVDTSGLSAPPECSSDIELHRWLYTAFTRAVSSLHLVNLPESAIKSVKS